MAQLKIRNAIRRLADGQRSFELTIKALTLGPRDRKAIVGPSGSGKSTAMDMIGLASLPDRIGDMTLELDSGQRLNLANYSQEQLAKVRRRRFGYVLQGASLFPFLSIGANVLLSQRLARRFDRRFAIECLRKLNITAPMATMPQALSVGQRQRVAIARSIAHRPSFLLADEPTAALDPENARRALSLLVELAQEQGTALLIVTHDRELVADCGFDFISLGLQEDGGRFLSAIDDGSAVQ